MIGMNIQELIERFESLGVPPRAYSVGSERNESYSMVHENGKWTVFYSERGNRNDEMTFIDEHAACREFFDRVTRDRIIQSEMVRGTE